MEYFPLTLQHYPIQTLVYQNMLLVINVIVNLFKKSNFVKILFLLFTYLHCQTEGSKRNNS